MEQTDGQTILLRMLAIDEFKHLWAYSVQKCSFSSLFVEDQAGVTEHVAILFLRLRSFARSFAFPEILQQFYPLL